MQIANRTACLSLSALLLAMLHTAAAGKTFYVDDDATGANDGSSWGNAYNYLQDALADANSADKPVEIRVAQGIYKPDLGGGNTLGDREATFQLTSGVALKGSFAGVGTVDPDVRDVMLLETVLSGDLNGDDVAVVDPEDLEAEPTRAENSYHVITGSGTDETTVLDASTVTAGNADGPRLGDGYPYDYGLRRGAGMYNNAGSPKLTNCTFSGNSAKYAGGGGMYNYVGNQMLINCIFSGNSALGQTGASGGTYDLWCSTTYTNCTFNGNIAKFAPGIYVDEAHMKSANCIFWDGEDGIFDYDGFITITHSDVRGGWFGRGNIAVDPCFADPGYWDPNGTPEDPNDDFWVDGDYHLKSEAGRWDPVSEHWVQDGLTSPCIDVGNLMSPIGPEPFPNGGLVNMEAYGGTAEASKSHFGGPVCETIVAGDINGDYKVDFADFILMALHWLEDNSP